MTISSVHVGDIIRCDVRGDRFFAIVTDNSEDGKLAIESANGRPIPTLLVGARQVVGHWRKRKGSVL